MNDWKLLNILTKNSILDISKDSEYAIKNYCKNMFYIKKLLFLKKKQRFIQVSQVLETLLNNSFATKATEQCV